MLKNPPSSLEPGSKDPWFILKKLSLPPSENVNAYLLALNAVLFSASTVLLVKAALIRESVESRALDVEDLSPKIARLISRSEQIALECESVTQDLSLQASQCVDAFKEAHQMTIDAQNISDQLLGKIEFLRRSTDHLCTVPQQTELNAVRDFITNHRSGLLDSIYKDADLSQDLKSNNLDLNDVAHEIGYAYVFCPLDSYDNDIAAEVISFSDSKMGVPFTFYVTPIFFNEDFCTRVGIFFHEGVHGALGQRHSDTGFDHIYHLGAAATAYCESASI